MKVAALSQNKAAFCCLKRFPNLLKCLNRNQIHWTLAVFEWAWLCWQISEYKFWILSWLLLALLITTLTGSFVESSLMIEICFESIKCRILPARTMPSMLLFKTASCTTSSLVESMICGVLSDCLKELW